MTVQWAITFPDVSPFVEKLAHTELKKMAWQGMGIAKVPLVMPHVRASHLEKNSKRPHNKGIHVGRIMAILQAKCHY